VLVEEELELLREVEVLVLLEEVVFILERVFKG
jgi:hypothetical protein